MPDNRDAPDPADSYERSQPQDQPGRSRVDHDKAGPENAPDRQQQTVTNRQDTPRGR